MLAWEKDHAPHRAQRLSLIYERRNDFVNAEKWEGWRVANLRPLFEPILWFQKPYKTGGTIADNVLDYEVGAWNENTLMKYNARNNTQDNIIKVNVTSQDHGLHTAQKPLKLMELLISLVTLEKQIVLDPFMGSGTTCIAARNLRRHYIGIDIASENIQLAQERLNAPLQYEFTQ